MRVKLFKNYKLFKNVEVGDVFISKNEIFLRIPNLYDEAFKTNCINLSNRMSYTLFSDNEIVEVYPNATLNLSGDLFP